jgi:hypothetical protein
MTVIAMLLLGLGALPADTAAADHAWEGRWAMELTVATRASLPLLPAVRSSTVSLLLVDIERTAEGRLRQHHRVCDARAEGGGLARLHLPDRFVAALPARSYPVRFAAGGGYSADLGSEAIGFDPSVTGGRLPESADAPGVIDGDGDGAPGMTVLMDLPGRSGIRLHIAQSTHLRLLGRATSPDRIAGSVEIVSLDQRTLGADPAMFARSPRTSPDPGASGFRMVRLPPNSGCETVRERAGDLLPG